MQYGRLGLSFGAVLMVGFLLTSGTQALSPVISHNLSYFFGVKNPTDVECFSRTIAKHTNLAATVSFNNPTGKNINGVSMNVDRHSSHGFTVDKTNGQLGTQSISYQIQGPSPTPYQIVIKMYCAV